MTASAPAPLQSPKYRLRAPLAAVQLARLNEQSKRIAIDVVEIPAGSTIQLSGYRHGATSLIEAIWNAATYAISEEDFLSVGAFR